MFFYCPHSCWFLNPKVCLGIQWKHINNIFLSHLIRSFTWTTSYHSTWLKTKVWGIFFYHEIIYMNHITSFGMATTNNLLNMVALSKKRKFIITICTPHTHAHTHTHNQWLNPTPIEGWTTSQKHMHMMMLRILWTN